MSFQRVYHIWIILTTLLFSLSCTWASGESQGGLMDIQPGLSIWTIATFVVLFAILKKFAWKPLLEQLEARERHIKEALESSEKSKEESQRILEEIKKKLAQADGESKKILEEAQNLAKQSQQKTLQETHNECMQLKKKAREDIQDAEEKAMHSVWEKIGAVGIEIAGKVLQKSLTSEDHQKVIEDSLQNIRKRMGAS